MEKENETWLPVAGYEGLYEVSNLGRVRSLVSGRVLRPAKNRNGYLRVGLHKNGKQKKYTIHRLVCTAFHENPSNFPQVNHKNECKTDNRAVNLEWCNRYYNATYGSLADGVIKGKREVYQYTLDGEFVATYPSVNEAARQIGVLVGAIGECVKSECRTAGGFQWSYIPALFLDPTEGRFNNSRCKRVYQYSLDGRFVKEWPSTMEVKRQTGWSNGNICSCCNGKFHQRYGFRWFYSFQGYSLK